MKNTDYWVNIKTIKLLKKTKTLGAKIKKYGEDYEEKYNEAMKEIDTLARKTKIKFRKSSTSNAKKHLYLDFDANDNVISFY